MLCSVHTLQAPPPCVHTGLSSICITQTDKVPVLDQPDTCWLADGRTLRCILLRDVLVHLHTICYGTLVAVIHCQSHDAHSLQLILPLQVDGRAESGALGCSPPKNCRSAEPPTAVTQSVSQSTGCLWAFSSCSCLFISQSVSQQAVLVPLVWGCGQLSFPSSARRRSWTACLLLEISARNRRGLLERRVTISMADRLLINSHRA